MDGSVLMSHWQSVFCCCGLRMAEFANALEFKYVSIRLSGKGGFWLDWMYFGHTYVRRIIERKCGSVCLTHHPSIAYLRGSAKETQWKSHVHFIARHIHHWNRKNSLSCIYSNTSHAFRSSSGEQFVTEPHFIFTVINAFKNETIYIHLIIINTSSSASRHQ